MSREQDAGIPATAEACPGTAVGFAEIAIRAVAWDGADATGLRAAMGAELDPRYAAHEDRLGRALVPAASEIVMTLAAFDGDRAVACGSLRAMPEPVDVDGVPASLEVKKLEAIALYAARGWRRLPAYGDYAAITDISVCFGMVLPAGGGASAAAGVAPSAPE
ncbi:hypothetical protein [Georgenia sp. SYP-B2076]|uniref:hypothetical protein n=1 Tax=Georgenia sp. SYP-B2076 TaxID=2495881 RepID=UPI0013E0496E|nr:hypothetical protein [Georgenia sp. SYP-B2076]